jgi:fluoroacetyl-CoA thioesterase
LGDGNTSVGTEISLKHLQATPEGMTVTATATVTSVSANGRSVSFSVVARDEKEVVGEATHARFILNKDRFDAKVIDKKSGFVKPN